MKRSSMRAVETRLEGTVMMIVRLWFPLLKVARFGSGLKTPSRAEAAHKGDGDERDEVDQGQHDTRVDMADRSPDAEPTGAQRDHRAWCHQGEADQERPASNQHQRCQLAMATEKLP